MQRGFDVSSKEIEHGMITARPLRHDLRNHLGPDLALKVATTVGGHHSVFPQSSDIQNAREPILLNSDTRYYRHIYACEADSHTLEEA
jgi:hypothetical protein